MGKIVCTFGAFDVFHYGHANFLRRCRNLGQVCVGVFSDNSYRKYRGHKPVFKCKHRLKVIRACKYVSYAFQTNFDKIGDMITYADIIAINTEWLDPKKSIYELYGVKPKDLDDKLVYIPYTKGVSSTYVKEKIKKA